MKVSIVIPNWNGSTLLSKHLPAITQARGISEIVVVDDGSTDDSVELLHREFPRVRVIEADRHEGFASAVNTGVAKAVGEIVVLLNTDCEPEKKFLEKLLPHFGDANVFAVGCLDKSMEGRRIVLRGRGVARWRRGFYVHQRGEVDKSTTAWVSGGSGAFRKSMWDKLGGMDSLFNPFYWEDIDLSYRALNAGYRLVFEKGSVVKHFHEEGKIMRKYSKWYIRIIATRNQFQFIWKNVASLGIILSHMFWTPIMLVKALFVLDTAFVFGYFAAILRLPVILDRRLSLH
ncbi:glycosyltransferase family 2 protein [Candidatus Gottesmanbacteria bacterium]|nr:glycosyltransferase family 2 protein [Candidatus Gottesmanbacteria bacterium]